MPGSTSHTTQQARLRRVLDLLEDQFGVAVQSRRRAAALDMLIATILSQNTDDRNSDRAYSRLRERFPAWSEVVSARRQSVMAAIRTAGLADQKSKSIKTVLSAVQKQFGVLSLDPVATMTDDEAIALMTGWKGVGLKTASCVLLFSLGRDVCPVDTHVHRVCTRLGLNGDATTPEKTFHALRPIVPAGKSYSLHVNLIRFGRKICRAQRPLCGECPLFDDCCDPLRFEQRDAKPLPTKRDINFMILDRV